jgi:hypothetical protein
MRLFFRYILSLGILLAITSLIIPMRYDLSYPKKLGPKFDNSIRRQYMRDIVEKNAELVLIGDSVLVLSVDPEQLEQLTGKSTYSLSIPGSASAVWYLAMKNVIAKSTHKPRYVIIVFRDTILTAPGYRVNGKYFTLVDMLANTDDTLVIQKSFIQQMSPAEQWADRYLPLYGSRLRLRETLDYYTRYTLTNLTGCDPQCNDNANFTVFQDLNLDSNLLVEAIATAESYLYTPKQMDFAAQLDQSFLPDIIRLAQENNLQLILVRTKHLDTPTEASESAPLKGYIQALKSYAEQNGVIVLDFAYDKRLTSDLFVDSHHLSEAGSIVFTKMLAEALALTFDSQATYAQNRK